MAQPIHPQPSVAHQILGYRLRLAREAADLSQEAAGKALGLSQTAISRLEAGGRRVLAVDLPAFAALFRLSYEELLRPASEAEVATMTADLLAKEREREEQQLERERRRRQRADREQERAYRERGLRYR